MTTIASNPAISARTLVNASQEVITKAIKHASEMTEGGKLIDQYQVHTQRIAYLTTEIRAAHELVAFVERSEHRESSDHHSAEMAYCYAAEIAHKLRSQIESAWEDFGLDETDLTDLNSLSIKELIRSGLA
jgi:alkylation response protein AidB-like acyl-CoA dehydrogenase